MSQPALSTLKTLSLALLGLLLLGCDGEQPAAQNESSTEINNQTAAPAAAEITAPATPPSHAIVSAHPLATQAGVTVLAQGGNAFDAAIAIASTLAVVEPYSSGMGGGGFWLLHDAKNQTPTFLDARETAPIAAHPKMYQDEQGDVIPNSTTQGPLAAGIPGQPAAFVHIADNFGVLPLSASLAPAIHYARNGFPVDPVYHQDIQGQVELLNRYPDSQRIFLHNKEAPPIGHIIRQPELAVTLEFIAAQGFAGFYKGQVAQQLVTGVKAAGGIWQLEDLNNYQVKIREPLVFQHHEYQVTTVSPPSAGGLVLALMLNMLEGYDWQSMDEAARTHLLVEIMRRAYRQRAFDIGDSDFYPVPIEKLTSKAFANELAKGIDLTQATSSTELGVTPEQSSGPHTSHFSVLDTDGNRVAATLTINTRFGSGFVPPGTGVLLNNEMDDFSAKDSSPNTYGLVGFTANQIEPGKRPLSSMTPTFMESKNSLAILGTPGGSRITTMVFLGLLEHLENQPVANWVGKPRFHHQFLPDKVQFEPGAFSPELQKALEDKGHTLKPLSRDYGNMHGILWDKSTNQVSAAVDPRNIGEAQILTPVAQP